MKRLVIGLALGLASSAFAEGDELLDLIGSAPAKTAIGKAKKAENESAYRKIVGGRPTAEQNVFLTFVEKGEMEKALFQWPSAFDSSSFAKTSTGKALNAYLLYKNGLKVTSLESLLAIEKPESIHSELLQLWRDAAPDSDPVWGLVSVPNWKPFWTNTFGVAAEIRVRSRQVYGTENLAALKELIKKTQAETRERAWLSWQLVLALSTGEDSSTAAKALAVLMKAPNNPVSEDLMTITAARMLYQNGFLDAAAKYYQRVPKSSDYWFEAQEELGWTYLRKGEPQNTIAITKTLQNEALAPLVGPEPTFLHTLANLKVCDYPEVVKTLNVFRTRYKDRAKSLMEVSENANTPAVKDFVERAKKDRVTLVSLGAAGAKLPRFVTRDEVLAGMIATEKALEQEGKIAGDLYARSLGAGLEMKKAVESRVQGARSATYGRVKALSNEEVNEIAQILLKLHIVEAEVLQQLALADRVVGATASQKVIENKGTTGSQAQDKIVFPAEQETWFDELSNYKVDIKKGCQSAKR